jgi:multidrug efflux pump subunit AcrB
MPRFARATALLLAVLVALAATPAMSFMPRAGGRLAVARAAFVGTAAARASVRVLSWCTVRRDVCVVGSLLTCVCLCFVVGYVKSVYPQQQRTMSKPVGKSYLPPFSPL